MMAPQMDPLMRALLHGLLWTLVCAWTLHCVSLMGGVPD